MKINKRIYYHVNTAKKLNVGNILEFDLNTKNGMYDLVYNSSYLLEGKDANEILILKQRNKDMSFSLDEAKLIFKTINNSAFVMRELALEEIRGKKYPEYPSRLSCLYVTKSKDEAFSWSAILKRNDKVCTQILTLELTGDIYGFDGDMLLRKNCSYQEHLNNAEKYWSKEVDDNSEYLFLGRAKVVEIEEI